MNTKVALYSLRKNGFRIGRVRKHIIEIFSKAVQPVSAQDIDLFLEDQNIPANKTTIYRELDFLIKRGLIKELQLQSNIRHFESTQQEHHHHLVCESCNRIQPIFNCDLESRMNRLGQSVLQTKQFKINRHALEFFGMCGNCQ